MAVQKRTLHMVLALAGDSGAACRYRGRVHMLCLPTLLSTDDSVTAAVDHPPPAQRVVPPIPLQPEPDLDKPLNILLLGADSREKNDPGRADTIILVRLDPATKHVRLSVSSTRHSRHDPRPWHQQAEPGFQRVLPGRRDQPAGRHHHRPTCCRVSASTTQSRPILQGLPPSSMPWAA